MSDLQTPIATSTDSLGEVPVAGEPPSKIESAPRMLLNRSHWVFVIVLLLQVAAFYSFVAREISGAYPFAHDQAGYLASSHQVFENMLSRGVFRAIWQGMTGNEPTGMLLPSEGAFLYLLFGVSRAAALTVNLFHWIVLQCVVFATFWKMTRSATWGYYSVGLLLLTATPFQFVGGMFDFRVDFSAACILGVICSLVIYMQGSGSRRATWYLAGACCYAVCLRHFLLIFLGAAFGLIFLVFFARYTRATRDQRLVERIPLGNFLIPTFCLALTGLFVITVKYEAIYSYYVVGHITGGENKVRAVESGADAIGRYAFYPVAIVQQHLGYPALAVSVMVLLVLALLALYARFGRVAAGSVVLPPLLIDRTTVAFVSTLVVVTLVVLTSDTSKSTVVGSLFTAPVLLLVAVLTIAVARMARANATTNVKRVLIVVPLIVFVLGSARTLESYSSRTSLTLLRGQFEQIPRAYRAIGDQLILFEITNPKFFSDRLTDYQAPIAFQSSYYEMTGRLIKPDNPVGRDLMMTDFKPFREHLQDLDVAMISENISARDLQSPLPTEQLFRGNAGEIRNLVSTRMTKIDEILVNDHVVGIYVKPRAKVDGASGGWVTSKGLGIRLLRDTLVGKPFLVIKGSTIFSEQLKGGLEGTVTELGSRKALSAKTSLLPTSYTVEVDLQGHVFPPGKWIDLELKFDRFFVPRKAGISPDDRELVVLAPGIIRSEQTSSLAVSPAPAGSNESKNPKR